ncbi:MAG: hypothetical protein ACXACA_03360 [Candidatus Ranarchaeia archaeon]|jgi:hypothetical protein
MIKLKDLIFETDKATTQVADAVEDYTEDGGTIKFDVDRENLSGEEKKELEKVEADLEKKIDAVKRSINESDHTIHEGVGLTSFLAGILVSMAKNKWGKSNELDKYLENRKIAQEMQKYQVSAQEAKRMLEKLMKK